MREFSATVWAKVGEFGIRPIGSVEEAEIFLEGWPTIERSPLYYVAANSVEAAKQGCLTADEASDALVDFLATAHALTKDSLPH
ncbi:DUF982 domain-containing protein [Mesorhizobium sp. A623]